MGSAFAHRAIVDKKYVVGVFYRAEPVGGHHCLACIDDFIATLPMGYDTRIGASGLDLSGGQKQRLLIAGMVQLRFLSTRGEKLPGYLKLTS